MSSVLRRVTVVAGMLVIPLALLLFAQWPLRDGLQNYSRQANDVAQMVFALYAAVAVTAASFSGRHLALENSSAADDPKPSWRVWALLLCVAPWAVFLLWSAVPQMIASVTQLESFSEGLTPGYFVLRIALVMLPVLVLLEAAASTLLSLRRRKHPHHRHPTP